MRAPGCTGADVRRLFAGMLGRRSVSTRRSRELWLPCVRRGSGPSMCSKEYLPFDRSAVFRVNSGTPSCVLLEGIEPAALRALRVRQRDPSQHAPAVRPSPPSLAFCHRCFRGWSVRRGGGLRIFRSSCVRPACKAVAAALPLHSCVILAVGYARRGFDAGACVFRGCEVFASTCYVAFVDLSIS